MLLNLWKLIKIHLITDEMVTITCGKLRNRIFLGLRFHHAVSTQSESGKPILEEQEPVQDSTVSGESIQQESVSQEEAVSTPKISGMDETIVMSAFQLIDTKC